MTTKCARQSGAKRAMVKVDQDVKDAIDKLHAESGRTRIHIINAAVREYVKRATR